MKSVEQKLFEAYIANKGIQLTAEDVTDLILDDAVATRVSNKASMSVGGKPPGVDCFGNTYPGQTWRQFGVAIKNET